MVIEDEETYSPFLGTIRMPGPSVLMPVRGYELFQFGTGVETESVNTRIRHKRTRLTPQTMTTP